jgi:hypothetical protein
MPRHPPYTLKSLTTFIDHRQGIADCGLLILNRLWSATRFHQSTSGRAGTVSAPFKLSPCGPRPTGSTRSITYHFAKKGARRYLPEAKAIRTRTPGASSFQTEDQKNGQISRRFILQINLEPRIHLSKSIRGSSHFWPQLQFPPSAGEAVRNSLNG